MQKSILRISGFFPYLCVLFLNAFVDLGHKIIIQNTLFKHFDGKEQIIYTAIVNGLILLPFILLFTPSGYIADKYPKNKVMRISSAVAVVITLLITFCYYMGWFWAGFAMTFLLAVQSAFYSPAKYGFIKELVGETRLAQGNAAVQSTTMIAILMGTFFFSILFEVLLANHTLSSTSTTLQTIAPLGWVLVLLSCIELFFAWRIPQKQPTNAAMSFNVPDYIRLKTTRDNISVVYHNKLLWLTIIGLSVFWSISQVILAAYPAYAKANLGMTNTALMQGLMACAGIGIMIGSLIAGRVSRQHIETGLIPVGAAGITLCVASLVVWESLVLQGLSFLVLGVMGGFFVIPLNALMQYNAGDKQLGRVLASKNLIQNIAMLSFLILTALFALYNIDSITLILGMALVALIGTGYTILKLPQSLIRFALSRAFLLRYNVKVMGFKYIPPDQGVLLLGNHISWIDWALVQIAAPRSVHFVIERTFYNRWYLKGFLKLFGAIPISKGNYKASIETINELLQQGKAVCLFPEGTISRSGHLSTFKHGYEKAIAGTDAVIVPFYLHGLWGSRFSRSNKAQHEASPDFLRKRDLIVAFGKPIPGDTPAQDLKQHVFNLSVTAWKSYAEQLDAVPALWLSTAKRKRKLLCIADTTGTELSHHHFMVGVFGFAGQINKQTRGEQNIGALLPASIGCTLANFAVLSLGKTIVNLNFTASTESVQGGIKKANIQTIYTSRQFEKKLKSRNILLEEMTQGCKVYYLEDVKQNISKANSLLHLVLTYALPESMLRKLYLTPVNSDDTAAILFSSGSEGTPKGIELTHQNLSANVKQVIDMLNPQANEVIMSSLPPFHAFGLMATTYLPLTEGLPSICHADPTDVMSIAKGIAEYRATILFGTSTFFRLYVRNRNIHPLMLDSLRLVVAGAEKLNPHVRDEFKLKFSKDIYEGYGATETSPVISTNIPDNLDARYWNIQSNNRLGSVGMPIPGTALRVVDPDTFEGLPLGEEGLLLIAGPQVMKGYLDDPAKTKQVLIDLDGHRWYNTEDKAKIDEDGFLTLIDRYSRFAKLGGEMVSLAAVEQQIRTHLDNLDMEIMAVNLPDAKKGEKVVLLVANEDKNLPIRKTLVDKGMNALMIPSAYKFIDTLPTLGSGKPDFSLAKKIARGDA